jgi:CHAT domain-containing protein
MSHLWTYVVKPVLDTVAFPVGNFLQSTFSSNIRNSKISSSPDPPRIWWCATGPLTFLPIHASGFYNTRDIGFKISDFVASSYTPTLTALLKPALTSQQLFQGLLGVSQPCTPGLSRLPNAEKELNQIVQLCSNSLQVDCLLGEVATAESVVEAMGHHSWIHLACHAVQDTADPTRSAFCLHNTRLELSNIITKSFPHADFAFLSACQTASGDETLSEEAVHLAAGMLAAGYRSVIATMWSIVDDDAPLIAAAVYSHLVDGNNLPDSTRAAHALHHAVKRLREQLERSGEPSFLSWVPYIHVGL